MIRKKIKFSPKLQSSSLDDIKRFVPKDALNTPVISSYNNLPTSYRKGGETDPTDPTSKSDSIALKKYYDLQLKLEGNKDVRPFLGWEEQRRQEEETYKKWNRDHIGNIFNYLGIDKNEPTEYFSKQKSHSCLIDRNGIVQRYEGMFRPYSLHMSERYPYRIDLWAFGR